jgi:hypothetical protein
MKRNQNEKEAKTAKRKRIKQKSGKICKNRRKILRTSFNVSRLYLFLFSEKVYLVSLPSNTKKLEGKRSKNKN